MNFYLLHPSDTALDNFAADNPAGVDQWRMASHLEDCQECRNQVAFRRNLRAEARALPSPEPSADLLDRVLRDRAAGDRVILPIARRGTPARYRTVRIAAAVVVIAGVGLIVRYARTSSPNAPPLAPRAVATRSGQPDTLSGLRDLFGSTVFLPGVASAEESGTRGEVLEPVVPQIDGNRIRVRDAIYQRQYIDSTGKRTVGGDGTVRMRQTVEGGAPAWRFERKWVEYGTKLPGSRTEKETETILLGRRDLRMIRREVDASPYQRYSRITIAQRFNGDSVFGRMMTEGGDSRGVGRPILQRLPNASAPYISDAFAPLFLTSVRLGPAWHGRLSLVGWAVRDNDVYYRIELRVVGKDRVSVPAGTFDCWHFIITSGTHQLDYWARMSDGLGVRTRNETTRSTLGVSEIVLVRASQ